MSKPHEAGSPEFRKACGMEDGFITRKFRAYWRSRRVVSRAPRKTDWIEDGYGNTWDKCDAPECMIEIVRPGKAQCDCEVRNDQAHN